jgi:hypothetical protein
MDEQGEGAVDHRGRWLRLAKQRSGAEPVAALVRPAMRRQQQRCAGSTSPSNAASRWGTPDLATPVRAVTRSGVDDLRLEGNRTIRRRWPEWLSGAGSDDKATSISG